MDSVARQLKDRDHGLSFNVFTELDIYECGSNYNESFRRRNDKYRWTVDVVTEIRGACGNNAQRIMILGSPGKTAKNQKQNKSINLH